MIARAVRLALCAVVVWQAGAGLLAAVRRAAADQGSYAHRLHDTTDQRLARQFGDDVAVIHALQQDARVGEVMLCRVDGSQGLTPAVQQRVAFLTRLRHAVYPQPTVFPNNALEMAVDPIAYAEQKLPSGQSIVLLVFAGEPSPAGRPGWTGLRREGRYEIWRFTKG